MDPLLILLLGMAVVVGGILLLRMHAFLALIIGAVLVAVVTPKDNLQRYAADQEFSQQETESLLSQAPGKRVARGFGATCGKIGILIALAAVVGKCLLESGAAERIIRSAMRLLGQPRAPLAFLSSGFLLGVPVFFDTVFYLMIPLAKALGFRQARSYGLYVMAIIAGATMAHSLVPPTPGPLLVAGELGVDLGRMILGGLVVGTGTALVGGLYALWANRKWPIPMRDSGQASLAQLEDLASRSEENLPPLSLSLLPIVLPVILIAGGTITAILVKQAGSADGLLGAASWLFKSLGDPNIALGIAAALAVFLMRWRPRPAEGSDQPGLADAIQSALASGGIIILITSAGGAFGGVLRECGIGWRIEELASAYNLAILPLAFFVTTLVRTAQGSATVAMITAAGILGGMATQEQLGFHPLYVALAIGCGSKPFPWMNDSGFWVINRMSGMTVPETIRSFSFMLTLMGLTGLVLVMILARLFPNL